MSKILFPMELSRCIRTLRPFLSFNAGQPQDRSPKLIISGNWSLSFVVGLKNFCVCTVSSSSLDEELVLSFKARCVASFFPRSF